MSTGDGSCGAASVPAFQLGKQDEALQAISAAYETAQGCGFCIDLVARVDAQRLMSDNQIKEAYSVIEQAVERGEDHPGEKGKTLMIRGMVRQIGYEAGIAGFMIKDSIGDFSYCKTDDQ